MSTYHDPGTEGVESYEIKGAKIADTSNPKVARSVLTEALKDKSLTTDERKRIVEILKEKEPFIGYMENDELPLPDAAKRLGYHGIKVWENDDVGEPTSIFLWDISKARKK